MCMATWILLTWKECVAVVIGVLVTYVVSNSTIKQDTSTCGIVGKKDVNYVSAS